jgi:hypothetical protein
MTERKIGAVDGKMRPEIKGDCPWCDSKRFTISWNVNGFTVRCEGCSSGGPKHKTAEEAIEAWNRRFTLPLGQGDAPKEGKYNADTIVQVYCDNHEFDGCDCEGEGVNEFFLESLLTEFQKIILEAGRTAPAPLDRSCKTCGSNLDYSPRCTKCAPLDVPNDADLITEADMRRTKNAPMDEGKGKVLNEAMRLLGLVVPVPTEKWAQDREKLIEQFGQLLHDAHPTGPEQGEVHDA